MDHAKKKKKKKMVLSTWMGRFKWFFAHTRTNYLSLAVDEKKKKKEKKRNDTVIRVLWAISYRICPAILSWKSSAMV